MIAFIDEEQTADSAGEEGAVEAGQDQAAAEPAA